MVRIQVAKVKSSSDKMTKRELYATVCYYYPAYKLTEVQSLPYRDLVLLLKTAKKIEAGYLYNLTAIVQAPHSKKQTQVRKLLDHFRKIIQG